MRLTKRVFVFLLIGALPLLFLGKAPFLALAVLIYDLVVAGAVAVDFFLSPNPHKAFKIARLHDDKLMLGIANTVTIELRSSAPFPLTVTLLDETPHEFT